MQSTPVRIRTFGKGVPSLAASVRVLRKLVSSQKSKTSRRKAYLITKKRRGIKIMGKTVTSGRVLIATYKAMFST